MTEEIIEDGIWRWDCENRIIKNKVNGLAFYQWYSKELMLRSDGGRSYDSQLFLISTGSLIDPKEIAEQIDGAMEFIWNNRPEARRYQRCLDEVRDAQ